MILRTTHSFTILQLALLLIVPTAAPAIGQTDDGLSSRRVSSGNTVKLSDESIRDFGAAPIKPDVVPESFTRVASNTALQPLKRGTTQPEPNPKPTPKTLPPPNTLPIAKTLPAAKALTITSPQPIAKTQPTASKTTSLRKLPKLADPEKFRVKSSNANRKWITLQDDKNPIAQGADEEELKLLNRLPKKVDLEAGISPLSVQRAVNFPDVPDPNSSFVERAYLAPAMAASFQPVTKTWVTPDMAYRPLYFEEPNLERYGNGIGRWQPAVSGLHFFSSVLLLPYKMGATAPTECDYSIGYFRPGDCVPSYKQKHEFSLRGAIFEGLAAGTVLGGL